MTPEVKERIEQIRQGIVPEGYKTSRKGVIPNAWSIQQIRDFAMISSGSTPKRSNPTYWNGGIPWVTTGELECGYVTKTSESITAQALSETGLRVYPVSTLLMAMYGQGKTRGTVARLGIEAAVNQACAAISIKHGVSDFLYYALQSSYNSIRKLSNTGNQENLNADIIKGFYLILPPVKEQTKIAEILSTQDKAVELQGRKIEELKRFKQGCLEKMFPRNGQKVPEKRFPGFTGDWEKRKFKDSFDLLSNNTLSRAELNNEQGAAQNVHYGDILVRFGEVIDLQVDALPYITDEANVSKSTLLQNGDIIIADTAEDTTVGKCVEITGISDTDVVAGLHTIPCRPRNQYAQGYLGYFMNSPVFHNQLLPLMQGTKVTSVSKSALQDTVLYSPTDNKEQALIGDYFIKLDHLITLHQRELEEMKKRKKALMQLLLTGIARTKGEEQ